MEYLDSTGAHLSALQERGQVKLVVKTGPHSSEKQEPGKQYRISSAHHRMLLMLSSSSPTFCNIPTALTQAFGHIVLLSVTVVWDLHCSNTGGSLPYMGYRSNQEEDMMPFLGKKRCWTFFKKKAKVETILFSNYSNYILNYFRRWKGILHCPDSRHSSSHPLQILRIWPLVDGSTWEFACINRKPKYFLSLCVIEKSI